MTLALIVAMDLNGGIGQSNTLPWHLPDDLKFFKEVTQGTVLLMGRKTYESLPGVLPGRSHWVLSQTMPESDHPQVHVFHRLEEMLAALASEKAMVIGGGELYRQLLPHVDELYVTRVEARCDCDVFFPSVDWNDWQKVSEEAHKQDERHAFSFCFQHYRRIA